MHNKKNLPLPHPLPLPTKNTCQQDSTIPYIATNKKQNEQGKDIKYLPRPSCAFLKKGSCYLSQKPLIQPDIRIPGRQTDSTHNSLDFHEHF